MIRKVILFIGVLAAVYAAGVWLGSIYGKHSAGSTQREQRRRLEAYLDKKLKDIEIGQQFPPLPLMRVGSDEAISLRELMPDGGILFYFASECSTCLNTVDALNSALGSSVGHPMAVVIATGPSTEYLMQGMHDRGISLPLYSDLQDILRTKYDMILARAFFVVDSASILLDMGTLEANPDDYVTVLTR